MWTIAVILFAAISGLTSGVDEWSYELESAWGGVCTTGYQQSPMNIMSRNAIVDKLDTHIRGPLVFRGYGSVNASAVNDGHTLKWTIEEDAPPPMVSGGPLRGNYSFVQFHLHWLSEHAIDGMNLIPPCVLRRRALTKRQMDDNVLKVEGFRSFLLRYALEIHFVHVKTGLTAVEALERPDGMTVIAVLAEVYDTTEENEYALAELEPDIPYLLERNGGSVPASVIDLTRMFSSNLQSFYTYFGSLTTPNCQEVVTWIVMDRPIRISDTQFKMFTRADVGGISNYRSLQAVNGRVIHRSKESSANIALPSVFSLIGALLNLSTSVSGVMSKGVCTLVNMKKKFFGGDIQECSVARAFVN